MARACNNKTWFLESSTLINLKKAYLTIWEHDKKVPTFTNKQKKSLPFFEKTTSKVTPVTYYKKHHFKAR